VILEGDGDNQDTDNMKVIKIKDGMEGGLSCRIPSEVHHKGCK
jgi:hypothetical protein